MPGLLRIFAVQRVGTDGWWFKEDWKYVAKAYEIVPNGGILAEDVVEGSLWRKGRQFNSRIRWTFASIQAVFAKIFLRPVFRTKVTVGMLCALLAIPTILLAVILPQQQLRENPNRLGFLALSCLPPLFLLSAKNSPLYLLTGISYDRVNIIHRWLGRAIFILGLSHGSLWMAQWVEQDSTVMHFAGQKERYGLLTLSFLALITFSSILPIRKHYYPVFFFLHMVGYIGFLVAVNIHTIYARPWTGWGVVLIYGTDLIVRALRYKFGEARLTAIGHVSNGTTRIWIEDWTGGWRAGQHISVRIFFSPPSALVPQGPSRLRHSLALFKSIGTGVRPFESHSLTISRAPPDVSVLPADLEIPGRLGFPLFAAQIGKHTWSSDLYSSALASGTASISDDEVEPTRVMIDGPYGGLGFTTPYTSETVVLLAGGSGAAFTIAVLDETVGRVIRRHRSAITSAVDFVWCVKDYRESLFFLFEGWKLRPICQAKLIVSGRP